LLRYGLLAVQATLVAFGCYLIYAAGASLVSGDPVPELHVPPAEGSLEGHHELERYSVIAARNLFQTIAVAPEQLEPDREEIVESQLRFQLVGTAAADPAEYSLAILVDPSSERVVVRVGDPVAQARVVRIEPKRVIIDNRGRLEAITIDEDSVMQPAGGAGTANPRAPAPPRPAPSARGRPNANPNRASLSERLRRLGERTDASAPPTPPGGSLFDQVRMLPSYTADGVPDGLKVNFVQAGSEIAQMGVQVGDVIRIVNGEPIESATDGVRVLRETQPGDPLVVEVDRGGESLTLEHVRPTR
jgi:type II secretion system protein C